MRSLFWMNRSFVWVFAVIRLRLQRRRQRQQKPHNIYDAFNIILNLVLFRSSRFFFISFNFFYFSEYWIHNFQIVPFLRMEIIGIRAIFGLFLGGMYVFEGFPH